MKNLARILSIIGYFALASIPLNAAAAVVIDFATGLAGPGGTISYDGVNTVGGNINIGALTAQGTPLNPGTYTTNAILNFDTEANTISIVGDVPGLNVEQTTLLSGSFSSFTYTAIPASGGTTEIFSGQGPDIKDPELLAALGVPANTPFDFFGFTIESVNGTVVSTDIVNTAVPVPATVWLFGSGLLGLVGIARRKKTA
jgi:hypothetical protein